MVEILDKGNQYNVGHKTGFIEALDEFKTQIMINYCDVSCGFCENSTCPFDAISDQIKERYNDEIRQRRTN